ncbi:hypothetical protein CAI16_15655 [Virgibacillus dokdonensis]|uniref:Uncharacterized protein n=1 Tax=Virgibacillus dokdonensis TaxID=302167 RepID=A0A3E0WLV3_9BACI|nr:hypothetical protein [Virgibacillus dokdonensis]RFA33131.1 hypothetical protein CAI16_15655 [Virgibacillus dokdonensis]
MGFHIFCLFLVSAFAGILTVLNMIRGDILFAIITGFVTIVFLIVPIMILKIKKAQSMKLENRR